MAARRFWLNSAARSRALAMTLTPSGRSASAPRNPVSVGDGRRPYHCSASRSTARDWFALGVLPAIVSVRFHCGEGRFDRLVELVVIVDDAGEVGKRLEGQRSSGGPARRPHHHLGVVEVVCCQCRVGRPPTAGMFTPGHAEPRQIVVGVQHDRRHATQGAFLDESADQHRLTRSRAREDRGVLAQGEQLDAEWLARDVVDAQRDGRGADRARPGWPWSTASPTVPVPASVPARAGTETVGGSGISAEFGPASSPSASRRNASPCAGFRARSQSTQICVVVVDEVAQRGQRPQIVVRQRDRAATGLLERAHHLRGLGAARPRGVAKQEQPTLVRLLPKPAATQAFLIRFCTAIAFGLAIARNAQCRSSSVAVSRFCLSRPCRRTCLPGGGSSWNVCSTSPRSVIHASSAADSRAGTVVSSPSGSSAAAPTARRR